MSGNAAAIHRARSLRRNFFVAKNVAYVSVQFSIKNTVSSVYPNVIIEISIEMMLWTEKAGHLKLKVKIKLARQTFFHYDIIRQAVINKAVCFINDATTRLSLQPLFLVTASCSLRE